MCLILLALRNIISCVFLHLMTLIWKLWEYFVGIFGQIFTSKQKSDKIKMNLETYHRMEIRSCQEGDALKFRRRLFHLFPYCHWAVFVGQENLIHLWGERGEEEYHFFDYICAIIWSRKFKVRKDNVFSVVLNGSFSKVRAKCNARLNESSRILEIAENELNVPGYNVFVYNCESFVNYCRYNIKWSWQTICGIFLITAIYYFIKHSWSKITTASLMVYIIMCILFLLAGQFFTQCLTDYIVLILLMVIL